MAQKHSDISFISNKVADLIVDCAKTLKLAPYQVEWNDFVPFFTDYLTKRDGDAKAYNAMARSIKAVGGFTKVRNAHFKTPVTKESLDIDKQVKINKKEALKETLQQEFLAKYEDVVNRVFKQKLIIPERKVTLVTKPVERALHLIHSDNHIGAFLDPRQGLVKYSSVESARSLAAIAMQIADFKPQYRKNTKLYINSIGDLIDGIIHKKFNQYNLAEQVCMATYYMIQFVTFLSQFFPCGIEVNCVTGNHDRIPEINPSRATEDKSNSYATMVYFALKQALHLAKINNVKVNIPRTPWVTYKCFGANYWATHGDTIISVGNVGGNINVKSIENQINNLNASLKSEDRCSVLMLGHIHTRVIMTMKNGVELVTNPALIPTDGYANSIGIFSSKRGQQLIESVPGYPAGDERFLRVDETTDSNKDFDKIINPFTDF